MSKINKAPEKMRKKRTKVKGYKGYLHIIIVTLDYIRWKLLLCDMRDQSLSIINIVWERSPDCQRWVLVSRESGCDSVITCCIRHQFDPALERWRCDCFPLSR